MRLLLHGNLRLITSFSLINRHLSARLRARGHSIVELPSDAARASCDSGTAPDVYLFNGHPWQTRTAGGVLNVFALNYEYLSPDHELRRLVESLNVWFDVVLVPSPFLTSVVRAAGLRLPVEVVPWGVDLDEFRLSVRAIRLPTTKRFVFLYAGAVNERKGVDVLLRAYRAEFDASDDVSLLIKEWPRHPAWTQWAERLQRRYCPKTIARHAEIQWRYDESASLAPYVAAADVGVFPHRGEGFGLPILECIASGRRVIVTRGTGPDAFRSDESAWPIRSRRVRRHRRIELEPDIDHLRSLLRRAYERGRPSSSEARGIAATAARWTWQRCVARLEAVLQRHLRRARSTRANRRARTPAVAYGFHSRGATSWRKVCTEIDRSLATRFPNYRSFTRMERIDNGRVDIVLGQSEHCLELLMRARRQNPRCVAIVHQESTVLADRVAIVNRERRRCGVPPIAMSPLDLWRNRLENELADHFIVASSVARQCFIDHGADPARVHVIPHGIARDTCHVRPGARTSRFLFAGTDPFRKGIRILFAAWEQVALRDAELVCCTDLEVLRSKILLGYLVRNPSITVRPLLGYRAFRRLYREIDCQVLPSLEDTFSLAVADGMAAGKPAIVSDATGVKDLIVHGVSGHIVPAGDVDALATALRAFGADRTRLQAMGLAAHQAVQPHSWKRFRQRLAGLLQSIADERA